MSISNVSTLVFIDPTISDYQSLINGVHPDVSVIVLDPARDGVTQITQAIAQQGAVATIHIVSHGEPGRLYLGTSELGLATLSRYAKQLRSWSEQLTDNAEILIYGCKVAYGAVGRCFIQQFGRLTGATIAASANLTGSAALGGDWELEVKTGEIQAALVFPSSLLAAYPFVLAEAFPNLLYGVAGNDLRVINTADGSSNSAATLLFPTVAIARESSTGRVYYIEDITNNAQVAYWDPATNTNVLVGNTGLNPARFFKLAQAQDGTLYALTLNTTNLYTVNPATGAATSLGAITGGTPAFVAGSGDAAFDPQNAHRLFVTTIVSGKLELYTVDTNPASPTFRQATHIGDTGLGTSSVGSLAFGEDGQLYASSPVSGTHSLYRINQATGASTLIGSTGGFNFSDMGTLPTPTADVDIQVTTNTDGLTNVTPGSSITYTVTVKNNSSVYDLRNISVADVVPSDITGVTWTAAITGGGSFPGAGDSAGSGNNIDVKVMLNAGASVTYTITGTVSMSATLGSTLTNTATATVPDGIIDPNTANNSLSDTTTIGTAPDTTAPIVTVNTLTTNDVTPQLTGTVDDPTAIVTVTVNGSNYTATNNGDSTWTLANDIITPALASNTYDVTATATDLAGNIGTDTTTGELIVSTSNPIVTIDTLTTNDGTPQLTGTIDDLTAKVTVTVNGQTYTANNNGNSIWTLADNTITPALASGAYNVVATATNTFGNTGVDSTTNELIIDTIAPIITVNSLSTNDGTPQLTGTVDDPTATIQVTVNGKIYTATNNGNSTWTLANDTIAPALADGTYDVAATATDPFGNAGNDSSTNELLINSAAPTVTVNSLITNDGTPQLTGTVSDATATISVTVNGTTYTASNNGNGTWTLADNIIAPALAADTYSITAIATDNSGNQGTDSTSNELVINPVASNQAPVTQDGTAAIIPGNTTLIQALSATDADGTIVSYTISTLPPTDQGILFLGNPNTGGIAIIPGQVLTPVQISQLFFQSASGFAGSQFTYTATDDRGMSDPTPATVTLSLSEFTDCECGCEVGSQFTGNNRKDRLQGTPAGDILIGKNGNDVLRGLECDDLVKGGRGKDRLSGDGGRDTLVGGLGHDRLFGGRQDDFLKGGRGNDRLQGGEGNDRLRGNAGRDRLLAGNGNDTLNGGLGKDILRGGQGDDRLMGRRGNDRLKGGKGNDWIKGGTGRDRLFADSGNDTLNGGLGKDTLRGGNGDDRLMGRRGNDRLRGGAGQDTLGGGRGNDRLNGFKGNDLLRGGSGQDQLWGGRGNDTLIGGLRQDKLKGNQGHDRLIGGRNHDVLLGGGGDDVLWGGRGKDTLEGGAGNDQFIYSRVRDMGDSINQFETNQDVIDLSRIFAQPNYPGSQSFKQSVQLTQAGSDAIVHIDTNGKTTGGFISLITLKNVAVNDLSAGQFIL